jgi:hypothetical protein
VGNDVAKLRMEICQFLKMQMVASQAYAKLLLRLQFHCKVINISLRSYLFHCHAVLGHACFFVKAIRYSFALFVDFKAVSF